MSILVGKRSREKTTGVCNSLGIVSVSVKMDHRTATDQDGDMETDLQQLESTQGKKSPRPIDAIILLVKTNVTLKNVISTSYPYALLIICATVRIPYICLHCYIINIPLPSLTSLSAVKITISVTILTNVPVNMYRLEYIYFCIPRILRTSLGNWLRIDGTETMPNRISITSNKYNELGCNCNGRYGE